MHSYYVKLLRLVQLVVVIRDQHDVNMNVFVMIHAVSVAAVAWFMVGCPSVVYASLSGTRLGLDSVS